MKNIFSCIKSIFIRKKQNSGANKAMAAKYNGEDEIDSDYGKFPILIKRSEYESLEKDDRIQGIIDYINDLKRGLYTDEELDLFVPWAQMVYFVDYYRSQVNNGGLGQYFENSRFNESQNKIVLDGLATMGANKNRDLFQKACKVIDEASPSLIEHYKGLDADGLSQEELNEVNEELSNLTGEFFKLNHNIHNYRGDDEESLLVFTHQFIEKIDNLKIIIDESYESELKRVLAKVSNYEERLKQAEENWEQNKPIYYKASESICHRYGLELISVNALDFGENCDDVDGKENDENPAIHYHITTNNGYHYVIDNGEKLTLINGETKRSLGTMSKTEI